MLISTTDAQGLYTKALIDAYTDRLRPTSFLGTFFPDANPEPTLELAIEVQRVGEPVAVDVVRGTEGNRNQWTRTNEKMFQPPLYREYFDVTQLQLYDRLYGATQIDDRVFASYINSVVDKSMQLTDKIDRAIELQRAQILHNGIVVINSDTNIDYKRKAASIKDYGAGNYWATGSVDVFAQLTTGCDFLRQKGKMAGNVVKALCGGTALKDLLANTTFLARQNLFNMALDAVVAPQMGATGATYHGTLTCGSYKVELWAYPQYYDLSGTMTPYLNDKEVALLPATPHFKTGYAAVPQLLNIGVPPFVGKFKVTEFIDERAATRIVDVQCAALAIPTAIDQIYTLKVVA